MSQKKSMGYLPMAKEDNYMTPAYAIKDLFEYLGESVKGKKIWEPFYGNGGSTKLMKEMGFDVVDCQGKDFYTTSPPDQDAVLVTNPPFSDKRKILNVIINKYKVKMFAILLPTQILFSQYFRRLISGMDIDILLPHARIQFLKHGAPIPERCPLDTAWFCHGLVVTPQPLPVKIHVLPQQPDRKS